MGLKNIVDSAKGFGKKVGFGLGAIGLVGAISLPWTYEHFDRESFTGKITEKSDKNGYRISMRRDDNGKIRTFEVRDSKIELQFDASDVYGGFQTGERCTLHTYGFRWDLFSKFENVVGYDCPPKGETKKVGSPALPETPKAQ